MGKDTKISWCHHTFNGWWGCQRVSPECERCYAETFSKRTGHDIWGPTTGRRFFGDKHWNEPRKWNADALASGERRRVFCSSMSDVFEDRRDLDMPRARLWELIEATPALDWLLLTKRPENHDMVPLAWQTGSRRPGNLWFGTTCGVNKSKARIAHLLAAKWPAIRFLSMEPLLEAVTLDPNTLGVSGHLAETFGNPLINWVITGAESGPKHRPMADDWVRALRDQCIEADVPFFFKQRVIGNMKIELPELDGQRWDQVPVPR